MENLNQLCMGCMKKKPDTEICPYCHFSIEKYEVLAYYLKPQTILNGKYLIGKSIGEGGFGITYIGWDLNLEIPLAIKEYFPNGFVIRDHHISNYVMAFTGEKEKFYRMGKEKFLQEARVLAKFDKQEEIVSVRDYFQENGTAYIVMKYIVGKSFGKILKERERACIPFGSEEVFKRMELVIQSLEMVHKEGIIHRDISPDNIMITESGVIKLIDFGAAREFFDSGKSFSIVLKEGYAPEEQYRINGNQGPWTDVYALCATIYRAITGMKPPNSVDRLVNDEIKKPSELGIQIDTELEKTLMKGLAVRAQDRWQSMRELYWSFYGRKIEEEKNIEFQNVLDENIQIWQSMEKQDLQQRQEQNLDLENSQTEEKNLNFQAYNIFLKKSNFIITLCITIPILFLILTVGILLKQNDKSVLDKNIFVGDIVVFGQNNREWVVLDKEGDKALLFAKESVGEKQYHTKKESITWEKSFLRRWLNEDFYEASFSEEEKERICETKIKNSDNKKYGTKAGNDTEDKIFLLSIDEVKIYFKDEEARAIGLRWWLRSPGLGNSDAAEVYPYGYINELGYNIDSYDAVCPALWVELG